MFVVRAGAMLIGVALVPVESAPAAEHFSPRAFRFSIGTSSFTLQEVDVGAQLRCSPGEYVGVVLKDGRGIVRWSFNVTDMRVFLTANGCVPGTSRATIVGIAAPKSDEAFWVVKELSCGASCYGYHAYAFRFSLQSASVNMKTGYYDWGVFEEVKQPLGLGGLKFAFPTLILYVNNGYKECPSHWTRMIYKWTKDLNKFVLTNAVAYTSRQCYLSSPRMWPPDPGQ